MVMSVPSLSLRIEDELKAAFGTPDDAQKLEDYSNAVAKAVIDELIANAVITVTGVTSGGSNATGTMA